MSVNFQYENNTQVLIATAVELVDGKELLNKMKEFFSDEQTILNYKYGQNVFTRLDKFDISTSQIFSLAKLHI